MWLCLCLRAFYALVMMVCPSRSALFISSERQRAHIVYVFERKITSISAPGSVVVVTRRDDAVIINGRKYFASIMQLLLLLLPRWHSIVVRQRTGIVIGKRWWRRRWRRLNRKSQLRHGITTHCKHTCTQSRNAHSPAPG